jgi:hypothetical protein
MSHSPTTFVTSFINVNNNKEKDISRRFEKFTQLIKSGIHICVYVDLSIVDLIQKSVESYPNVRIMRDVWFCEFPFAIKANCCFFVKLFVLVLM